MTTQNKLANASSSYLRSAAHQPIDWYEFTDEAFEKARIEDKPILLDIGAVWCHWCHVIDRESYENDEIAKLINDNYIAVKVDRDERPDVDARYQQAVQSISGQGGWPLTGFLTHDGRVLYGGTYFPPHVMKQLLERMAATYKENHDTIFEKPPEYLKFLEDDHNLDDTTSDEPTVELNDAMLDKIMASAKKMTDPNFGGFGVQPKFPHFSGLELLITRYHHAPTDELKELITKALDAMAHGGIYDQVAGGLHRYSVDREWHVPHFEKMAYDNAEGLKVYAQAARLFDNDLYRNITSDIANWILRDLSDSKQGGFYGSQDADINLDDDGDHFTWTVEEITTALSSDEAGLIALYYDVDEKGDMHDRPGRNVLRIKRTLEECAELLKKDVATIESTLKTAKEKLLAQRQQREIPFIDTTLYTNWNGMMMSAFFEAGTLLSKQEWVEFAGLTLNRFLKDYYQEGEYVLHARTEGDDNTTPIDGTLDDYAQLSEACLQGYFATGNITYFHAAKDIMTMIRSRFEDKQFGGFTDLPVRDKNNERIPRLGLLNIPRKPVEDNPSSSPNGTVLKVLAILAYLANNDEQTSLNESLIKGLKYFAPKVETHSLFVSAVAIALQRYLHPPLKIELVGECANLIEEARHTYYPGKVLSYNRRELDTSEARLCKGTQCHAPARSLSELQQQVSTLSQANETVAG